MYKIWKENKQVKPSSKDKTKTTKHTSLVYHIYFRYVNKQNLHYYILQNILRAFIFAIVVEQRSMRV